MALKFTRSSRLSLGWLTYSGASFLLSDLGLLQYLVRLLGSLQPISSSSRLIQVCPSHSDNKATAQSREVPTFPPRLCLDHFCLHSSGQSQSPSQNQSQRGRVLAVIWQREELDPWMQLIDYTHLMSLEFGFLFNKWRTQQFLPLDIPGFGGGYM